MAMYGYTEDCPNCGRKIKLYIDTSNGPPREIGTECECGKVPVFRVDWTYDIWLNGFDHYEPDNNEIKLTQGMAFRNEVDSTDAALPDALDVS